MSSTGSASTSPIQKYGTLPTTYPVLGFVFGGCPGIVTGNGISFAIVCQLLSYSNPVFNIGLCGCTGAWCQPVAGNLNNITFLTTACKIELYERATFGGINVVHYTSLSELHLTINGHLFKSGKYLISLLNTLIFGQNLCNSFDYDDSNIIATISNFDYTKCPSIQDTAHSSTLLDDLQAAMNKGDPLLLLLPQSTEKMIILDKAYLPLEIKLAAPFLSEYFLLSTGDYNTVTVTQPQSNSSQTCAIRYSITQPSGLYVYTFGSMCNPKIIPSGALTSISVPGSVPGGTVNFCDGHTGSCFSQCTASDCNEPIAVSNPLESIVNGLVGSVPSLLSVLPSLRTAPNPIGILSNHISKANAFLP